jgi:UDP-glucose 4-epimerase
MRNKRVLVTGGAGFIGSALVRRLSDMGATVTVYDDFTTGRVENLEGAQCFIVRNDVRDAKEVSLFVDGADYVFHCAVRCLIASTGNPRDDLDVNVAGTLNVLLAAIESGARVVYTSSVSVYGNQVIIPTPEDALPDLLSPYAVSKYAGEGYCRAMHELHGLQVSTVRLSNVYGPGQSPSNPYCGVVAKFMQATLEGQPMQICGDGAQTRDFTYVDDAVDATIKAALEPRAIGDVFNVGTGVETSVSQLAVAVMNLGGKPVRPESAPPRDIDAIRRRATNVDKARRVLRWRPSTSLRDGLEKTWRWMKEHA